MNELLKDIEWRKHIPGLALFGVALVLLIISALHYIDEQSVLRSAVNGYKQQQNANLMANNSRQILDENMADYRLLVEKGVIGTGERLQWIEVTQKLSGQYRIPLVEFSLDSAVEADEEGTPYWNGDVGMMITPMALQLDLRHEGDFYRFMDGLAAHARGLFSVERCQLTRRHVAKDEDPALAGLEGKCSLLWYTLNDLTTQWEKAGL